MDTRTVSTESKGVMQEIREHLGSGKSTGEVIALGYKPGTVYKVNRWFQRKGGSRVGSPLPSPLREVGGARIQGRMAVVSDPDLGAVALYHFDPPVPCPGCGRPVVHWEMCSLCSALLPAGCACPEDAPSRLKGYTLQQLQESLSGRHKVLVPRDSRRETS